MDIRYCIVLVNMLLFTACTSSKKADLILLNQNEAKDSLYIEDLADIRELHNMTPLNDSELVAFSYYTGDLTVYRKKGFVFSPQHRRNLNNSFYFEVFFYDSTTGRLNLVGQNNLEEPMAWFYLDTTMKKHLLSSISIDLPYLHDKYRLFAMQEKPLLRDDSSFTLFVSHTEPQDYPLWLKEKLLARIIYEKDSIKRIEFIFDKPKSISHQYDNNASYCRYKDKVVLIYPCLDSLYIYDLHYREIKQKAIGNPDYVPAADYDYRRVMESDYMTKMYLHGFAYQGVFYNPSTEHFVLYYTTPADKTIKVPSFDDKRHYALVLDTNYAIVQKVEFANRFRSPASFLSTNRGIYMPLYVKNQENETFLKYYLFDL